MIDLIERRQSELSRMYRKLNPNPGRVEHFGHNVSANSLSKSGADLLAHSGAFR
jgi:hypothetical protein